MWREKGVQKGGAQRVFFAPKGGAKRGGFTRKGGAKRARKSVSPNFVCGLQATKHGKQHSGMMGCIVLTQPMLSYPCGCPRTKV